MIVRGQDCSTLETFLQSGEATQPCWAQRCLDGDDCIDDGDEDPDAEDEEDDDDIFDGLGLDDDDSLSGSASNEEDDDEEDGKSLYLNQ